LGQDVPADHYAASPRSLAAGPYTTPDYDHAWHVRKVKPSGEFKWKGSDIYATQALAGHYIGLMPKDNGTYTLYFHQHSIGELNEKTMKIHPMKQVH